MKIGVLTFHNTLNYGAQLQAYALQKTLDRMGLDAEIVDYRNAAVAARETPLKPSPISLLKHPRDSVRRFPAYRDLKARSNAFREFAVDSMRVGPQIREITEMVQRYQTIVVGSDQVWNLSCTGGDLSYFLAEDIFADLNKVSYAASFGTDSFPRDFAERCGEAIRRFKAISVREEGGVGLVRSLSDRDAELVLDPTLLLRHDEWASLGNDLDLGRYVFAYMVGERKRTFLYACEEAKRRGAVLVAIDCYHRARPASGCFFRNSASIEEFIGLIRDAELVVTSSFHGLALSLALETDVRYCLNSAKGNRNSRLENLASLAGVEYCNISNSDKGEKVDFDAVRIRMERERVRSLAFLSKAITQ